MTKQEIKIVSEPVDLLPGPTRAAPPSLPSLAQRTWGEELRAIMADDGDEEEPTPEKLRAIENELTRSFDLIRDASPDTQQAIHRLRRDLYRVEPKKRRDALQEQRNRRRIATILTIFPSAAVHVADLVRENSWKEAVDYVNAVIARDAQEPLRPAFDADQHGLIVEFIRRDNSRRITATDDKTFQIDGVPVNAHMVDHQLWKLLRGCELWSPNTEELVTVDRQFVSKIRTMLALQCHDDPPMRELPHVPSRTPVVAFLQDRMVLDAKARIEKSLVYPEFERWCVAIGVPPVKEPAFFKLLIKWSQGRIRTSGRERQPNGGRVRFCYGIRIRDQ